jgi:hypothetical protein
MAEKPKKTNDRKLATGIGTPTTDTHRLLLRGKDTLRDLVGKVTFTESIFLAVTGTLPAASQTRILDACLVILMDHGITPSALVTRLVADSVPTDLQIPIAAGLLTVGNKFIGTMAGAGALLQKGVTSGLAPEAWAAETVAEYITTKRRFPGFGHPDYFPDDRPRQTARGRDREAGRPPASAQRHRRHRGAAVRDRLSGRGDARRRGHLALRRTAGACAGGAQRQHRLAGHADGDGADSLRGRRVVNPPPAGRLAESAVPRQRPNSAARPS